MVDRCGTLAQNDGSIAVGVIIDGKAERIAEVAQLKIVVSPDVVDRKTVRSLSVDQNRLLADNGCFGLIPPARKLAADRGIFLPGNDRDRIALLIERNGKAAVRLAQKLRKIAQLEIVAAVDVVFVTVCIDAVDRQVLRRDRYVRSGGVRHGNANQEQRQNDGQSLFHG